ncbi:MAG: metal-dependent hydrolase [Balneolaceae bacterium]|nr:metal-dependent hydrolase [Balneolaceae bacterium]
MWGAVFGIVPDLDILANPFLTEVQELIAHRGITHSIFFCIVASPIFGWLLSKLKWNRDVGWKSWSWLVFWCISTHIFIDLCTGYGTQIFQPFNNYPASLNSIFIIDPFYTVPLMLGIGCTLFLERNSSKRQLVNYIGLGVSSLYLLAGLGIKLHVNSVFEANFDRKDIAVERYMTTPAPLTSFLWVGYAESNDTIYAGLYSVFDDDQDLQFVEVPKNTHLIYPYKDDLPTQRTLWFSRGYYTVERHPDGLKFTDLRFGRSDLWLTDSDAPYTWNFCSSSARMKNKLPDSARSIPRLMLVPISSGSF